MTRPRILKAWGVCVAFGYCAAILSFADRGSLNHRGFVLAMAAGSLPGTADPWGSLANGDKSSAVDPNMAHGGPRGSGLQG